MAEVIKTERGETYHTVKVTQRELDVLVGLLGSCWCREEDTNRIYNALKSLRVENVNFEGPNGQPLPCIQIKQKED